MPNLYSLLPFLPRPAARHVAPGPFADDVRLDGARVVLRPLTLADAPAMLAYARDPEVTRYLPWEPVTNVMSVRAFLAEQTERRRKGASLGFAIVLKETGQVVGSTDIMEIRGGDAAPGVHDPKQAEVGYLLARPFWGRGLMTEAARLTVAYAFDALERARLTAFADADNCASRRVLEKAGMHEWGTETRTVKGQKRLYIRYEMLKEEI